MVTSACPRFSEKGGFFVFFFGGGGGDKVLIFGHGEKVEL